MTSFLRDMKVWYNLYWSHQICAINIVRQLLSLTMTSLSRAANSITRRPWNYGKLVNTETGKTGRRTTGLTTSYTEKTSTPVPFDFETNGNPFGSKSKGKLSPWSYPIQFERKLNTKFLSVKTLTFPYSRMKPQSKNLIKLFKLGDISEDMIPTEASPD